MSLKRNRRGNAAVFGISLLPLLGFAALSVDIGLQRMSNVQLQAAAEAGALGGASYLSGDAAGLSAAINGAVAIANANDVYGDHVLTADDVEIGIYDPDANPTFQPVTTGYNEPGEVNAVRVDTTHTHASVLAGAVFGQTTLGAVGESMAIQPRGGIAKYVDCYLPFAIPVCLFEGQAEGTNPPPINFVLNSNVDNGGFGLPPILTNNPTPGMVSDQLINTCANGTASTDMTVEQNNGNLQPPLGVAADIINDVHATAGPDPGPAADLETPISWPPARNGVTANIVPQSDINTGLPPWGNTISGVVPIVDAGLGNNGDCSGINMNQDSDIVGWTWTYIFDVKTGANTDVWMQFDFVNSYDFGYGQCEGDCFGNVTGTEPPMMVL